MMTWYYNQLGEHVHVKVYMNGAFCGKLCFRVDEFQIVREHSPHVVFLNQITNPAP
jgi:hypothetical protein